MTAPTVSVLSCMLGVMVKTINFAFAVCYSETLIQRVEILSLSDYYGSLVLCSMWCLTVLPSSEQELVTWLFGLLNHQFFKNHPAGSAVCATSHTLELNICLISAYYLCIFFGLSFDLDPSPPKLMIQRLCCLTRAWLIVSSTHLFCLLTINANLF